MLRFDGGYISFDSDTISGIHYYIKDYMGNNRMVVNRDGTVEQVTHYYPYGGIIGDISTNQSLQKYKFEGKELDRTFGLDNYDIHARQYFSMAPVWDRIDPMAEKDYAISPYVYCGGDPVNRGDYDGMSFTLDSIGHINYIEDKYGKTKLVANNGQSFALKSGTLQDLFDNLWEAQKNAVETEDGVKVTAKSETISENEAVSLFKFLADNTKSEWGLTSFFRTSNQNSFYTISTRFEKKRTFVPSDDGNYDHVNYAVHSHPFSEEPSFADLNNANSITIKTRQATDFRRTPTFFIYRPTTQKMIQYDKAKVIGSKSISNSWSIINYIKGCI